MIRPLIGATLCAAILAGSANSRSYSREVIEMTAASGLSTASTGTAQFANFFIPEVDRRLAEHGKYEIKWITGWGGSIAGQYDLFEAIEDGIADIGYVNTLFESAKLPFEQMSQVTPFGSNDLKGLIEAFHEMRRRIPEIDQAFLRRGQVRLAVVGSRNYHLLTTFEINSLDDIRGKKFGAPGMSANWLAGTGAVIVAGSLSDYYNSLKTGVYNGIIIFESGISPFRFYEVAPYITEVGFGAVLNSSITINKRKWESLPEAVKIVFWEVATEYEDRVANETINRATKSVATAIENGAIFSKLPDDERKKLAYTVPNIAQAWAKRIDESGQPGSRVLETYMSIAREKGFVYVRDWDME